MNQNTNCVCVNVKKTNKASLALYSYWIYSLWETHTMLKEV